ncbi:MAG: hypothetical protein HYR96_01655 [Deltaproteobacteria bacterium]|nr:hypothetical protein [Deltaproteobacteria bacterium]MBI3295986.1 hypothetical protein [Deltaproteobacteria bacterium]
MDKGTLGVLGNVTVQDRLFRYLGSQRIHPALIFSGPRSDSKLAIVKNAAKTLFCRLSGPNQAFCGTCSACDRIEREIFPDVWVWRELDEEIIKIESIREICTRMALSPVEGSCRVCIIDDCHRMNPAAANAFLKTLEEPNQSHYFWLLTSQLGSLLPTLRSRCLEFSFQPDIRRVVPDRAAEFDGLYQDFLRSGDPYRVTHKLREKSDVLAFVHYLQARVRQEAVNDSSWYQIHEFERLMELEHRLRSNASYGLLLESHLAAIR